MTHPDKTQRFTVEIEALYSFTRMLMIGFPPIRPVLINCQTREPLNSKPEVVREIFGIYRRWYHEQLKSDFKNMRLPLTGSPYCWLGQDEHIEKYMRKPF